ncbi:MAG: deoxyribonuclease IV [Candidatus Omnitrophica bacterium]|nr:deoxyribonuclease IV [Candidatus Omnitrophota bacterium]
MKLGVHISGAGRIYETLERAQELGCNTMQIFSRSPQRWRERSLSHEDIEEFKARKSETGINPVFIHIAYLINLASPDRRLYRASINAYVEDILEAQKLKAEYIVTHMGSHKNTSENAGLKRLTEALNIILEKTYKADVGILLENTAGSGSWLGYKFEHQQRVIAGLTNKKRIGLCLDTAHAYLAGYDIATAQGLEAMLEEIDKTAGLGLVKLIHLNDAKGKLGSRHDRHEHIGKGRIGLTGMKRIINHPKLRDAAFILETPKDSEKSDAMNLNTVRKLRKE